MKIGYARVSTEEQSLEVQMDELSRAKCDLIFVEKQSGKNLDRPELERVLLLLSASPQAQREFPDFFEQRGEIGRDRQLILVVTKLDRLARNTRDLLEVVERIGEVGASFISLSEPWADTTSPAGKLIMTVFAGVAQFERERMLERTNAGRARAIASGVRMGGKPKLTAHQQREALKRFKTGEESPRDIARSYNVDKSTIYRLARKAGM